jgi:hypothetical protein
MGYSSGIERTVPCKSAQLPVSAIEEGARSLLQQLKSQGFRIVVILSALASSALVLQAGQRWH